MRRSAGALLALMLLAGPVQAFGAGPKDLGVKPFLLTNDAGAEKPNVAVDDMGVGHFAWNVDAPYPASDPLVYCRVPRGATACQSTQTFNLPLEAFGETQVLTPAPGQVIILTFRGYGTGEGLYAIVSEDGGNTFAVPRLIADNVTPGQAAYGPGTGAVSVTNHVVGGVDYQAASLDGYTEESAEVGNGGNFRGYDGTIGFPDAQTPLVAYDNLETGYFRVWSGKGNVNDIATWLPEQTIGLVDDLRIATGPKGVVLLGSDPIEPGSAFNKYTARRYDTTTGTFGAPVDVSNPKIENDVIFRDVYQDPGGNIAAAFVANGTFGENTDPIRYRVSVDGGKTWKPERTLVTATDDHGFNLQIGAAADGGGFLAYDGNGSPPLMAVPIPPVSVTGGGGGGSNALPCEGTVSFGNVQAIATSGCLQKHKDGTYTTSDPVRLNGLDLAPQTASGRRARAAAKGEIEIDPKTKKVHLTATDVKAGNIVLDKGTFDWDVGKGAPVVTTFAHLEKFDVSIFGFPVTGTAELKFDKDGAFIPAHLELPKVFGGITGDVTLRLKNPDGLKLEGFKIHVGEAFLGALKIKPLDVIYKGGVPSVFEGSATLLLPPSYSDPGAKVAFGFVDGKFKHAEGSVPFDPPLAISPPWAYLRQIGLALSTDPLYIAGGVELVGGPQIGGKSAITIDALPPKGFSFTFGDPSIFHIEGAMKVVDVPFAKGFVEFRTNGLLKFGGGLDFNAYGLASVTAGIPTGPPLGPGFVDLSDGRFNAPYEGHVCVPAGCSVIDVGSKGVISSTGIAACGEYLISTDPDIGVSAGFGYAWGGDVDVFGSFGGCDIGPYAVSARRRQAGTFSVAVPAGLPQENIVVGGTGGVPRITVTAPDGEKVSSIASGGLVKSKHMALYATPAGNATTVLIGAPAAGTYTIAAQSGSPAIAKVANAHGLPEPSVSGAVGGSGYKRTLSYTVAPIDGQTVRFVERADGAGAELGAAKGAKGTLRFRPANGPKGERQIVALVEQNGVPRTEVVVGTYVAPGPQKPGRPGSVKVQRAGAKVKVRWGKAARAASYIVRIKLRDGTNRLVTTAKRSATLPGVSPRTVGTVSVQGVSKEGTKGPSRKAGVKKKRKKKAKRKG